jgi:hypothetical protein
MKTALRHAEISVRSYSSSIPKIGIKMIFSHKGVVNNIVCGSLAGMKSGLICGD